MNLNEAPLSRERKRKPTGAPSQSPVTEAGSRIQTEQPSVESCDPVDLQSRIATRAYELYEQRGFQDGQALDDWLQAEREIRGR